MTDQDWKKRSSQQFVDALGLSLIPGVSSQLLSGILLRSLFGLERNKTDGSSELVEQKLKAAAEAIQEASEYMATLQTQLASQKVQLDESVKSYEHYQKLAQTEEKNAQAFIAEMAKTISQQTVNERKWAFVINMVAGVILFVIGVVAADPTKNGLVWLYHKAAVLFTK